MANKQWVAGPQEGWGWTVREQGGKREKKYIAWHLTENEARLIAAAPELLAASAAAYKRLMSDPRGEDDDALGLVTAAIETARPR